MKNKSSLLFILAAVIAIPLQGQTDKATHVENSIRTSVPRRYMKLDPIGTYYFVSVQGDDRNPGTKDAPFRHIQRVADIAQPGDVCFVREGVYRETVRPKNSGRRGDPIRYVAYPGEKVTINGSEVVEGEWSKYKGSIYKTRLDVECQQLFVDGEMMIEARWPNMTMDQLWERSSWAASDVGSVYGKMVDADLAETDVDWTGAIATLNIAHQFSTWTRKVTNHEKGSDSFEYPKDFGKLSGTIGHSSAFEDDFYYLTGKLGALDIATEWYYDAEEKMLYLWTPDGKSPEKHTSKLRSVTGDSMYRIWMRSTSSVSISLLPPSSSTTRSIAWLTTAICSTPPMHGNWARAGAQRPSIPACLAVSIYSGTVPLDSLRSPASP